jgi:hypothetical protein
MPPSSFGAGKVSLLHEQLAQTHGRSQGASLMGAAKRRLSSPGIATTLQQLAKHSGCLRVTPRVEMSQEHVYPFA